MNGFSEKDEALLALGRRLAASGYHFVPVTPATHERVVRRLGWSTAKDLRGIFGWNLPFNLNFLPNDIRDIVEASGQIVKEGRLWRATVRYSNIGRRLFVHSGFPTQNEDSVFLGPDTYRFVSLLERTLPRVDRLLDVGAGCGGGALSMAKRCCSMVMTDINPRALGMARINAELTLGEQSSRPAIQWIEADGLQGLEGEFDAIIANPPFMADSLGRDYRNGGGSLGAEISLRLLDEAMLHLRPGGRFVMYTGSAIVDGKDHLRDKIQNKSRENGWSLDYAEIDPDIFGEELSQERYCQVERLAAVGLVVARER